MDEQAFDGINVVPLVDIMLVLLTIVLTTSSFIASGRLPVKLPQASRNSTPAPAATLIEVAAGGDLHFNGRPLPLAALGQALQVLPRSTPMLIRADRAVSLQRFIDVADTLQQLGFSKVALQTENR